jgi:hypothetical protein
MIFSGCSNERAHGNMLSRVIDALSGEECSKLDPNASTSRIDAIRTELFSASVLSLNVRAA